MNYVIKHRPPRNRKLFAVQRWLPQIRGQSYVYLDHWMERRRALVSVEFCGLKQGSIEAASCRSSSETGVTAADREFVRNTLRGLF